MVIPSIAPKDKAFSNKTVWKAGFAAHHDAFQKNVLSLCSAFVFVFVACDRQKKVP
jgi:hypothetical protein